MEHGAAHLWSSADCYRGDACAIKIIKNKNKPKNNNGVQLGPAVYSIIGER